jgi:hypothetical protein
MVVPYIKGIPSWRELFGLGLQADSPTGEKYPQRTWTVPWPDFKKMRFVLRRLALESTLPPHNDGAARRVAEMIESCFHAQSEFL